MQTNSFRAKAAQLRAMAEAYIIPDLRAGILEVAEFWEQLALRIEADRVVHPTRHSSAEAGLERYPLCGEEMA